MIMRSSCTIVFVSSPCDNTTRKYFSVLCYKYRVYFCPFISSARAYYALSFLQAWTSNCRHFHLRKSFNLLWKNNFGLQIYIHLPKDKIYVLKLKRTKTFICCFWLILGPQKFIKRQSAIFTWKLFIYKYLFSVDPKTDKT